MIYSDFESISVPKDKEKKILKNLLLKKVNNMLLAVMAIHYYALIINSANLFLSLT